jgi:hypothetical protein
MRRFLGPEGQPYPNPSTGASEAVSAKGVRRKWAVWIAYAHFTVE